jgi:hypothetical protein
MVLGIFIGGMFLGLMLGFAIMALLAFSGDSFQGAEAQEIRDYPACAYPPIRKVSPLRRARPQNCGVLLTPWP